MELSLYRKYRPQTFDEISGQDHVVKVLEQETKTGKVSHSYLFSGSRGIGKTSIARIFAKALKVNPEDVYEIDAASNRGIDEIREIRDSVHAFPYSSKYKIYIVDEVHMLTKEAWNAFLKTLEEPPSHVIFILATTEEYKLPDTVISRCECFAFKKPTHEQLSKTILEVSKKEGYSIEKKSASLIATLADGSFRDALSILQKTIHSSKDKNLSHKEVEEVLGSPRESLITDILDGIQKSDASISINAVKQAREENNDMAVLLTLIIRSIRFVLLLRFAKEMKNEIINQTGEEEFEKIENFAKNAKNINSKTLLRFLEALGRQSFSSIGELPIEIAIIESIEQK
jgi:DNA polymerase-3 subunit gamma/tau